MPTDQDNRGPGIIAATVVLWILAVVAVSLRVWSRRSSKIPLWWDDWVSIVALFFSALDVAVVATAVHVGVGQHVWVVGFKAIPNSLKAIWASEIIFTLTVGTAKLCIVLLYFRIFGRSSNTMRMALIGLLILVAAWTVATLILSIFQCTPIDALWNWSSGGKCVSPAKTCLGTAIPDVITDALLLIAPLPRLFNLQMPAVPKVGLAFAFVLGGLTLVASSVRLKKAMQEFDTELQSPDATWTASDLFIWSSIECQLAVLSANLPSLGGIVKALGDRIAQYTSTFKLSNRTPHTGNKGRFQIRSESTDNFGPSKNAGQSYASEVELPRYP